MYRLPKLKTHNPSDLNDLHPYNLYFQLMIFEVDLIFTMVKSLYSLYHQNNYVMCFIAHSNFQNNVTMDNIHFSCNLTAYMSDITCPTNAKKSPTHLH